MKKAIPSSITVEEAVAEMVNMDYIPTGLTLLEMLAAFQEEAEIEHENAQIDQLPEDQVASLKNRMDSCSARSELARHLLKSLQYEVDNSKNSMIVLSNDSSSQQRLTLESVSDWAGDKYGIGVSRWAKDSNIAPERLKNVSWEDVTIKIWKNHSIGYSFKKGEFERFHFRKIGLMGEEKNVPNKLGLILIGLSKEKKYPHGNYIQANEKTAISKLRRALISLSGLSDDPFIPYNKTDGWKPRFTLIDDVNNADDRVKKKAIEESYDDDRYYETDD